MSETGSVYLSVEGAEDEHTFLRKLHESIDSVEPKKTPKLTRALRWINKKRGAVDSVGPVKFTNKEAPWSAVGDELRALLSRTRKNTTSQWYVMIDELPVFIDRVARRDKERAKSFLSWFRALRQEFGPNSGVHWIVAGSIGLAAVAERFALHETVNDFKPFDLGPFSRDEATALLHALATSEGLTFSVDAVQHACVRIGWLAPYFVQIVFDEVRKAEREVSKVRGVRGPIDVAIVDDAFERAAKQHSYYDHWRQRIDQIVDGVEAKAAAAILDACAKDDTGATRDTLRARVHALIASEDERSRIERSLLDLLEHDGYIVREGERWKFQSPLLRAYWERRFL